jgi:sugar phosphate permease
VSDTAGSTLRRYRWAVLAAGTAAQTSGATIGIGLPSIAPALREEYGLGLAGVGLLLAAGGLGLTAMLLPWGLVTDRIGERRALGFGLIAGGVLIGLVAFADDALTVGALFVAQGAAGASVQSASGRAVMQWFGPDERGFAFGIRQTAIPLGGVIGALVLPALTNAGGLDWAFAFLAAFCVATGVIGAIVVRDLPSDGVDAEDVPWTLRDSRLWLLSGGSSLYVTTQIALFTFLVLFLHDERGFSAAGAAAVFGFAHVLAIGARIAAGRWSDVLRSRVVPLRRIGIAMAASLAAAALLLEARTAVVVPLLVVATAASASWNGLSFVAAAELAGTRRSGAAIGFQQTALGATCVVVPPLFGALVDVSSWRIAFAAIAVVPLAGWVMLGRVRV